MLTSSNENGDGTVGWFLPGVGWLYSSLSENRRSGGSLTQGGAAVRNGCAAGGHAADPGLCYFRSFGSSAKKIGLDPHPTRSLVRKI